VKSHELTEPTFDSALRKKQIEKWKLFGDKRQLQQSPIGIGEWECEWEGVLEWGVDMGGETV